jgi:hypothetical protein
LKHVGQLVCVERIAQIIDRFQIDFGTFQYGELFVIIKPLEKFIRDPNR